MIWYPRVEQCMVCEWLTVVHDSVFLNLGSNLYPLFFPGYGLCNTGMGYIIQVWVM